MVVDGAGWWETPVAVKTAKPGVIHHVSNAAAGLEELRRWPRPQSLKWRSAFELCVAANEGKAEAEDARAAFVTAAKSTGNLVS